MLGRARATTVAAGHPRDWQTFAKRMPAAGQLIEIRRRRDDKTILRRSGDLPPAFARDRAEWRSI